MYEGEIAAANTESNTPMNKTPNASAKENAKKNASANDGESNGEGDGKGQGNRNGDRDDDRNGDRNGDRDGDRDSKSKLDGEWHCKCLRNRIYATLDVSNALRTVHNQFLDAIRPHTIRLILGVCFSKNMNRKEKQIKRHQN